MRRFNLKEVEPWINVKVHRSLRKNKVKISIYCGIRRKHENFFYHLWPEFIEHMEATMQMTKGGNKFTVERHWYVALRLHTQEFYEDMGYDLADDVWLHAMDALEARIRQLQSGWYETTFDDLLDRWKSVPNGGIVGGCHTTR